MYKFLISGIATANYKTKSYSQIIYADDLKIARLVFRMFYPDIEITQIEEL